METGLKTNMRATYAMVSALKKMKSNVFISQYDYVGKS